MRKTIQGMQLFNYLQIYLVVIKHVQFLYFNRYLVTRLKNLNYKRKKLSTCVREENCGTKVTLPSVQQPCLTDGDIEFLRIVFCLSRNQHWKKGLEIQSRQEILCVLAVQIFVAVFLSILLIPNW